MISARKPKSRQRAMAVRQALRLCEAELVTPAIGRAAQRQPAARVRQRKPRVSTARAALVAVGLPPQAAAALRRRLQLICEQEDQP